MVTVRLPDGSSKSFDGCLTALDVARSIGPRLAQAAVACKINGEIRDLAAPVPEGAAFEVLTESSPDALFVLRHSTAHIMADAVMRVLPGTKLTIGPPIEDGFYYDLDTPRPITSDDFPAIEAEMKKIVAEKAPFVRREIPRAEAERILTAAGQTWKVEILKDIPAEAPISFYRDGAFDDLCEGPHLPDTGRAKAFKLTRVSGSYWRGDQKNKMLQRLYGTAWFSDKDLQAYLTRIEEAKKRDHRFIGPALGLFSLQEEAPGSIFWHPRGTLLYNTLVDYVRDLQRRRGYQEVKTPQVVDKKLYERSGHWENFRDKMFLTEYEERTFCVKPMNCPGACLIFKSALYSYRDLPLRLSEFGSCHRVEPSGTLHGLMRVRAFVQDDAHIFTPEEKLGDEILGVMDMASEVMKTLGFEKWSVKLATRPAQRLGTDAMWDAAEAALERSLKDLKIPYEINPGEGAFYGPEIEINLVDALNRSWQCGTVQVDYALPERFDLEYVGTDGARHRPVIVHRAILGSLERFIGVLIEHHAGASPLWLSPVQARVLPLADASVPAAEAVRKRLLDAGIRAEIDATNERLQKRIRNAELEKIPYIAVVGPKEAEAGTVAVRIRRKGDVGASPVDAFVARLRGEIDKKAPPEA